MSENRFKDCLTTCSAISDQNPPLRKPPRSSVSRQLQRLDPPEGLYQLPRQPIKESLAEEKHGEPAFTPLRPHRESRSFSLDARGPYEPLVLSSPRESPLVQVPASINCRLLEHQREGVRFLYCLYKNDHGGVLGDDMGLGKTIQTIALLAAVFGKDAEPIQQHDDLNNNTKKGPVLIFSEWAEFSVAVYHGPNREMILEKLDAHCVEILITSFDTFRIHDRILSEINWEIVVVDEAHRLKNEKSRLYKACLGIKTRKRIGLTGTIMQNKILELFNLFDWVSPGSLGTREHFRDFYEEPLKHGQRSSAPDRFVQVADKRKQHLVSVLKKYLLRRTKEETIGHLMLGKEDNVVFCAMSELQKRVYKRMLEQPDIQCLINKDLPCSCGSPLTQAECCHRIVPNGVIWSYLHRDSPEGCDSCPFCLVLPCLIKLQQISNHLELIKPNPKDEIDKQKKDAELASAVFDADIDLVGGSAQNENFMGLSDVEHCGKMRALEKLMLTWTSNGDKILLFSYSVRMLDILEKFLIRKGYCFARLDGSTPMSLRQSLVDDFNRSPRLVVLGLNLVSANRVVIFDPNWNPAQDLQAQDRSFRYGQKRHVVVFRLLAAGSLEELVYSRQVYKQQLSNIAVSGKMEKRYFEGVQDCKEFKGELFGICNLFRDLSDKLFTSEIIELHGKQQPESENAHCTNESTKLEMDHTIQSLLINPKFLEHQCHNEQTEGNEVTMESSALSMDSENKMKLTDFGIVYAHRNEEVVNMGPSEEGKSDEEIKPRDNTQISPKTRESIDAVGFCKRKQPTKQQKLREYNRIAQYMGMEIFQFSRWILSAYSLELDQMLQKYKKKKKQGTEG
ncbi:hypothetical protein J5N97_011178 [Dioscorea zingiberensis]|uniref:Switch 2 n=1 Tax=Dioscorea zingiberensis TaxID=325984 RepID=A0A9D5HNC7_9LILI|nr:hypothetical protein J5N97_011178 [Dioscorea zingiberensis]